LRIYFVQVRIAGATEQAFVLRDSTARIQRFRLNLCKKCEPRLRLHWSPERLGKTLRFLPIK